METINNNATTGTLAQVLQSAAFVSMDSIKGKEVSAGNRWCRLIKKGDNSKLPESLAVEIPAVNALPDVSGYAGIQDYLIASFEQLRNEAVKARAIAGDKVFNYSALSLDNLNAVALELNEASGIGQLSEEKIKGWFDTSARDNVLVALADKLGVSEDASEADVKRLEQIANQMRDNLAKLSSKKPVQFDERVKKALNMALDSVSEDDIIADKLRSKLNASIGAEDLLLNLGL